MSDPSFIYSCREQSLENVSSEYKIIWNLKTLYSSSDREKVKNHSSILTKFVIFCIVTMLLVIGFFLAVTVPGVLPLGTTAVLISSIIIISLFSLLSLGAGVIFYHLHKKIIFFLESLVLLICIEF